MCVYVLIYLHSWKSKVNIGAFLCDPSPNILRQDLSLGLALTH